MAITRDFGARLGMMRCGSKLQSSSVERLFQIRSGIIGKSKKRFAHGPIVILWLSHGSPMIFPLLSQKAYIKSIPSAQGTCAAIASQVFSICQKGLLTRVDDANRKKKLPTTSWLNVSKKIQKRPCINLGFSRNEEYIPNIPL